MENLRRKELIGNKKNRKQLPVASCFFFVGIKRFVVRRLFQHAEFLAHLDKGSDALVEMLALVAGRNLHADTGLIFRHYGSRK